MTSLATRTEKAPPIKCVASGAYCGVLGIFQLQAAGQQRICCRHYLEDDAVVAIYDALYEEGGDR